MVAKFHIAKRNVVMLAHILVVVIYLQVVTKSNANTAECPTGLATRRGRRLSMEDRAGAWDIHCRLRDSAERHPEFSVWAVFDGHGSAAISAYLHVALVGHLRRRLCAGLVAELQGSASCNASASQGGAAGRDSFHQIQIRSSIQEAFQDADTELRRAATAPGAPPGKPAVSVGALGLAAAAAAVVGNSTCQSTNTTCNPINHSSSNRSPGGPAPPSASDPVADMQPAASGFADAASAATLAAAAAAAWDCGSTAVVAVADWTVAVSHRPDTQPCPSSGSGSNCSGNSSQEGCNDCNGGCRGGEGSGGAGSVPLLGGGAPAGQLWVASVGNSRAILCKTPSEEQAEAEVGAEAAAAATAAPGPDESYLAATATLGSASKAAAAAALMAGSPSADSAGPEAELASGPRRRARRGAGRAAASGPGRGGGPVLLRARVVSATHELDDEGERRRVEAAGGRVEEPGRPGGKRRLMGDLEVSRSFGDLQYRPVGLSADPDIAGPWSLGDRGLAAQGPDPDCDDGNGSRCRCRGYDYRVDFSERGDSRGGPLSGDPRGEGSDGSGGTIAGRPVDVEGNPVQEGACSSGSRGPAGAAGSTACSSGGSVGEDGCGGAGGLGPHGRVLRGPPGLPAVLVLASDGVLDVMEPQDVCAHVAAQLTGAAEPPLAPPLPPPIALGSGAADTPPASSPPRNSATDGGSGDAEETGGGGADPAAGLPGCCDCGGVPSGAVRVEGAGTEGQEEQQDEVEEEEDPCAKQALSTRTYRRPVLQTVESAAERLVQQAVNRGSMDNVAALVVQLSGGSLLQKDYFPRRCHVNLPCTAYDGAITTINAACTDTTSIPPAATPTAAAQVATASLAAAEGRIPPLAVASHPSGSIAGSKDPLKETAGGRVGRAKAAHGVAIGDHGLGAPALPATIQPGVARVTGGVSVGGGGSGALAPVRQWPVYAVESREAVEAPAALEWHPIASLHRCEVFTEGATDITANVPWDVPVLTRGHDLAAQAVTPGDPRTPDAVGPDTGRPSKAFVHSRTAGLMAQFIEYVSYVHTAVVQVPLKRLWYTTSGGSQGVGSGSADGRAVTGGGGNGGGSPSSGFEGSRKSSEQGGTPEGIHAPSGGGGIVLLCANHLTTQPSGRCPRRSQSGNSRTCDSRSSVGRNGGAGGADRMWGSGGGSSSADDGVFGDGPGEHSDGSEGGGHEAAETDDGESDIGDGIGGDGREAPGYGYVLKEKISAVPSMPYHLHAPIAGGDILPPWQLSDFAGASHFLVPGLSGGTTGWLIDSLSAYDVRPYDTHDTYVTLDGGVTPMVGCHGGSDGMTAAPALHGREGVSEQLMDSQLHTGDAGDATQGAYDKYDTGKGPGRSTLASAGAADAGGALMSYGVGTFSLLEEIGSVPLQLTGGVAAGRTANDPSGRSVAAGLVAKGGGPGRSDAAVCSAPQRTASHSKALTIATTQSRPGNPTTSTSFTQRATAVLAGWLVGSLRSSRYGARPGDLIEGFTPDGPDTIREGDEDLSKGADGSDADLEPLQGSRTPATCLVGTPSVSSGGLHIGGGGTGDEDGGAGGDGSGAPGPPLDTPTVWVRTPQQRQPTQTPRQQAIQEGVTRPLDVSVAGGLHQHGDLGSGRGRITDPPDLGSSLRKDEAGGPLRSQPECSVQEQHADDQGENLPGPPLGLPSDTWMGDLEPSLSLEVGPSLGGLGMPGRRQGRALLWTAGDEAADENPEQDTEGQPNPYSRGGSDHYVTRHDEHPHPHPHYQKHHYGAQGEEGEVAEGAGGAWPRRDGSVTRSAGGSWLSEEGIGDSIWGGGADEASNIGLTHGERGKQIDGGGGDPPGRRDAAGSSASEDEAPVVALFQGAFSSGGGGGGGAGAGSGGGSGGVVIVGPQLQTQPRAHGVRQADGALHLVTASSTSVVTDRRLAAGPADGLGAAGGGDTSAAGAGAATTVPAAVTIAGAPASTAAATAAGSSGALSREYRLRERFGQGHFGEVWRAWRLDRIPMTAAATAAAAAAAANHPQPSHMQPHTQQHQAGPSQPQASTSTATRTQSSDPGGAPRSHEPLPRDAAHPPYQSPRVAGLSLEDKEEGGAAPAAHEGAQDQEEPGTRLHDRYRRQQQQREEGDSDGGAAGGEAEPGPSGATAAPGQGGYVLKRLRGDGGGGILLSGLREAYFGDLLRRLRQATAAGPLDSDLAAYDHLVNYIESFEVVPEPDPAAAHAHSAAGAGAPAAAAFGVTAGDGSRGGADAAEEGATTEDEDSSGGQPQADLWLVFRDAGQSLHDLIYSPVGLRPLHLETEEGVEGERQSVGGDGHEGGGAGGLGTGGGSGPSFQVLGPSPWWRDMRRHPRSHAFVRDLMRQLLVGLQVVHEANVTHRDVKPENMMLTRTRPPPPPSPPRPPQAARQQPTSAAAAAAAAASTDTAAEAPNTAADTSTDDIPQHHQHDAQPTQSPQPQPHQPSAWQLLGSWARLGYGSAHAGGGSGGGGGGGAEWGTAAGGGGGSGDGGEAGADADGEEGALAPVWLRLIDFGSAVDGYSLQHLYGHEGPTSAELTLEYAPPEALFGRCWEGMTAMRLRAWTYDIWSVGVVWLELMMATPQVWQLPAATRALLEIRLALRGQPESERHLVFLLRGLMEWCIYPPQAPAASSPPGPPLRGRKSRLLMSWSCTEEALLALARSRDPLGIGLEGPMALRLLMRLLHWDPASRPSARQALQHAYFTVRPADWPAHSPNCGAVATGEPGWC